MFVVVMQLIMMEMVTAAIMIVMTMILMHIRLVQNNNVSNMKYGDVVILMLATIILKQMQDVTMTAVVNMQKIVQAYVGEVLL